MNKNDWLNLAISKDETSPHLLEAYRDKTNLVATDGHRLHLINNLPEATPGYVSGLNLDYPDYKTCIPDSKDCQEITFETGMLKDIKKMLADLKKIAGIIKPYDSMTTVKLTIKDRQVKIESTGSERQPFFISYKLEAILPEVDHVNHVAGINLSYLIDALRVLLITESPGMELLVSGQLAPMLFKFDAGSLEALVMPIRLMN